MPSELSKLTRRILRHYDRASAADLAAGLDWYRRAEREAAALAAGTELSTVQCAGIIAALSPRVQWQANLDAAALMMTAAIRGDAEPVVAGLSANRAKAWKIANGEDPSAILKGPKVTAFFANITGDHDAVTVDVHAARAAEGRDDPNGPKGKRYERIAEAYRRAALCRNVTPRECQAAVWVYVRGRAYGNYSRTAARA